MSRGIDAEQCARRQELRKYVTQLKECVDENGDMMVDFPAGYEFTLQQMMDNKREQNLQLLRKWLGIHKYEDLPIQQVNEQEVQDPVLLQGLQKIQHLDQQLHTKTIELKVLDREMFPEKWRELDENKAKQRELVLTKALKKLRKKREQAAELRRTLNTKVPEQNTFNRLNQEEEDLVEGILERELEPDPYEEIQEVQLKGGAILSISEFNQRLEDFAMDHEWDEAGSMYDIRSVISEDADFSCRSSMRGCPPISISADTQYSKVTVCVNGKIDYLREIRQQKEMMERQKEIGAQLQELWMNDNSEILDEKQIRLLVRQCLRQQEAASRRQSKQNSCAQSEVSEAPSLKNVDLSQFQNLNPVLPPIPESKLSL
eukprot:TRINITY_DN11020_c0_g1_i3.p1 TRINITY_DN11020_c0_g1~~TRINITY_DN11020_c0_g1_i3.p1  ORF type:complete len:373 (-),score=58.78 TRINITY_DN11020_c0_g1_i3:156-1274(-)